MSHQPFEYWVRVDHDTGHTTLISSLQVNGRFNGLFRDCVKLGSWDALGYQYSVAAGYELVIGNYRAGQWSNKASLWGGGVRNARLSALGMVDLLVKNSIGSIYAPAASAAQTLNFANGDTQKFLTSGNFILTLPAPVANVTKSCLLMIKYGGAHTFTVAGGGNVRLPVGMPFLPTSLVDVTDFFTVFQDGVDTFLNHVGIY